MFSSVSLATSLPFPSISAPSQSGAINQLWVSAVTFLGVGSLEQTPPLLPQPQRYSQETCRVVWCGAECCSWRQCLPPAVEMHVTLTVWPNYIDLVTSWPSCCACMNVIGRLSLYYTVLLTYWTMCCRVRPLVDHVIDTHTYICIEMQRLRELLMYIITFTCRLQQCESNLESFRYFTWLALGQCNVLLTVTVTVMSQWWSRTRRSLDLRLWIVF